jgi:dipeptidase
MRADLPDPIGGVVWWTNDEANMTAFTPIYCGVTEVPQCYIRMVDKQDEVTFSWESAFWLCNTVSNMVYPYYSKMIPDLRKAQAELEDAYAKYQTFVEEKAKEHYASRPNEVIAGLTKYSLGCADRMMKRWNSLFQFLVVKHNDMVVKKEENGKFKRTPNGYAESPVRPGYSEKYWKKVVDETGNRYKLKK